MTTKLLANQLHGILADPVEGFTVELADESSLYDWKVYIEGPKDTPYEGGVFQLSLKFPKDYPMSPPVLKFISDFWHPNVYNDGKVCMSILHPPGEDAMSGELAQERWLPTQSVTTIVLSLLSLLNDPNCSSPANVDASVEWRKSRESYVSKCKKLVERANKEKPSHVVIPHPDTNEEEHKRIVQKWKEMNKDLDYEDFYENHEESGEEESESDEESDENENEFLESNGEINSEDEKDEVSKKKNGADKATPLPSPDAVGINNREEREGEENRIIENTTTTTTTSTSSSIPPPPSSDPSPSSSSSVPPPSSSVAPAAIKRVPSNNAPNEIVVDNSLSNNNNSNNNSNNSNNNNNDNNNNMGNSPRDANGKKKRSKTSKKKKCTIM